MSHKGALTLTPGGMKIDRELGTVCGECAQACPAAALEVIGRRWTPDELMNELVKDQVFYETSGGGIALYRDERDALEHQFVEGVQACRAQSAGERAAYSTRWTERVRAKRVGSYPGLLYSAAWRGFDREAQM